MTRVVAVLEDESVETFGGATAGMAYTEPEPFYTMSEKLDRAESTLDWIDERVDRLNAQDTTGNEQSAVQSRVDALAADNPELALMIGRTPVQHGQDRDARRAAERALSALLGEPKQREKERRREALSAACADNPELARICGLADDATPPDPLRDDPELERAAQRIRAAGYTIEVAE